MWKNKQVTEIQQRPKKSTTE